MEKKVKIQKKKENKEILHLIKNPSDIFYVFSCLSCSLGHA